MNHDSDYRVVAGDALEALDKVDRHMRAYQRCVDKTIADYAKGGVR